MSTSPPRDRAGSIPAALLAVLLLVQLPLQFMFWRRIEAGHSVLWSAALLAVALTAAAIYGIVRRRDWAPWPALCGMTWSATILLQAWSLESHWSSLAGLAVVASAFVLLMLLPAAKTAGPTWGVRVFFAAVASLTSYVAFWGLAFPNGTGWGWSFLADSFDASLPFNVAVPTLHARVIGSFYLAATVVCLISIFSRTWDEARLGTWMILLWTGSILGITLTHAQFFDWTKPSVWFWYVAYLGYPAIAAWILKQRMMRGDSPAGRRLPTAARAYLAVQGAALIVLAGVLQWSPTTAAAIWPWAILALLSRFYSAPLLTFGLSSLVAARCQTWREVRSLVAAVVVAAASLLVASCLHRDKFNFAGPAAWVWFSILAVIGIANLSIAIASCWSADKSARSSP